jgi:hypothetical protein
MRNLPREQSWSLRLIQVSEEQVRLTDIGVALFDKISNRGRQRALDRALEGQQRDVVAPLGFRNHGVIIVAAQRASDIHPLSVKCGGSRTIGGLGAAQALGVWQELGGESCSPLSGVGEKRLQGWIFDEFGRMNESPLGVLTGLDQAIQYGSRT